MIPNDKTETFSNNLDVLFVIDSTMNGMYDMDLGKLAYIGKQGVLMLMNESVFSEKVGFTSPNHKLDKYFKDVVEKSEGR